MKLCSSFYWNGQLLSTAGSDFGYSSLTVGAKQIRLEIGQAAVESDVKKKPLVSSEISRHFQIKSLS